MTSRADPRGLRMTGVMMRKTRNNPRRATANWLMPSLIAAGLALTGTWQTTSGFALEAQGGTDAAQTQGSGSALATRKAEREAELEALTRDLTLSAERQTEIEREIRTIERDRKSLNSALLRTAQRVTQLEEQLAATEERLRRLGRNEDAVQASLAQRQDVLAEVLAALQRIGRRPPPALAVRPSDALGAVRSALLLNAVMPEIHLEAQALASDLANLRQLKVSIAAERDRLVSDTKRLNEERARVELLVASKKQAGEKSEAALADEKARSQQLAEDAESLKDLIATLEREIASARDAADAARAATAARRETPATADPFRDAGRLAPAIAFAEAKGRLLQPVTGTLLRDFGAEDGFGGETQGRSIATRAAAQVTSPADGWIVYAGPFRSYGEVLILNAGDGYHILLAGMGRVNVEQGQFVLAGEPVATMGATRVASAATLDLTAPQPVLYVEFRKDGISIDPTPWWAPSEDEKVGG